MDNQFTNVGVEGGIPKQKIVQTIKPGDDIQAAIDDASKAGGGVVLLESGTYQIGSTIEMEDDVALRGEDRESVILKSNIRGYDNSQPKNIKTTFQFEDDSYAGIENLTIDYTVNGLKPVVGDGLKVDGGYIREAHENNPGGRDDLYVRQITIDENSQNNWVTGVNVINSGTNPIRVVGDNNTLRDNLIDGSYNKGSGGNGYYAINGDNNLIQNETVREIRHFAVQRGAKNNVIVDSDFYAANIDFHNGDGGNNLVERNTITIPNWFSADPFDTGGGKASHKPPGKGNILFNNEVTDYGYGASRTPYSEDDVVYTYKGFGEPVATNWEVPDDGSFFF